MMGQMQNQLTPFAEQVRSVSVIIIDFNDQKHIGACLDSVLKQTYPNYEVIVVDNASTDGSPELIADQYPQVKLVRAGANLGRTRRVSGVSELGYTS
jgi:glycosyltransferase involved in cell wall biosynthesis